VVHDVLFEDTVLAIARIVASPKSAGKPNLTITRFPELVILPSLEVRLPELVQAAQQSAAFAQDWRDRHLAHRDLNLALRKNSTVKPLSDISRAQVEGALSALREVLDCIEGSYCGWQTAYNTCLALGDAKELLYVIRGGLLRERERHETRKRGELHPDDINPPDDV
jgi:HEPN superfamily AbiU2-like protein